MNITPADRVLEIQEYYFSKKLREVAELNAQGKDIISLGIGSPDRMPSEEALNTLNEVAHQPNAHGYQSYQGIPELRKAFSDFYKRWYGVDLDPNKEILPLIGSKEGVFFLSLTFINPGDGVLVPNPGYPTYTSASKIIGARMINYDLSEENGWQPDFEKLEKMDLTGVKMMWCNYPNMPTGGNARRETFEKLVDFGLRHNIIIVNDNPYSFILNDNPMSILSVPRAKECCFELNSTSKALNMPGWRIGMLAGNPELISYVLKAKSNVDSGMFKPMQMAAAKALAAGKEWYDSINTVYRARRKYAEAILDYLGCTYDKTQVGMFMWGKIPASCKSCEELADKILYDCRVFVTPGFIFGSNGDRYIRLSLCATEEKLAEALQRIKDNLKM